jgi:TRAP-type C4-dicarboxylate transport system permease small subunit
MPTGEATPLANALRAAERAVAVLSRIAAAIAGAACLACFLLVCYTVFMRYFLNQPLNWTDEAVGWLIVIAVMLAVPEAQRRGENIGVDAVIEATRGRLRRALLAFGAATVLITSAILVNEGIEMVAFTRMIGMKSMTMPDYPLWAIQALVPIGAALMFLVAILQFALWAVGLEPRGIDTDRIDTHE